MALGSLDDKSRPPTGREVAGAGRAERPVPASTRVQDGGGMSFRTLAVITAVVTAVLGAAHLAAGALMVGRWQIEPTVAVLLMCRRIGALYVGLAVMMFLARRILASEARTALCAGAAVITSSLALLGVYELSAGHVGPGIVASIAVETLLALGFIWILIAQRKGPAGG